MLVKSRQKWYLLLDHAIYEIAGDFVVCSVHKIYFG